MCLEEANKIVKNKLLELYEESIKKEYKKIETFEEIPRSYKNILLLFYSSILASKEYKDLPKEDILKIINKYRF